MGKNIYAAPMVIEHNAFVFETRPSGQHGGGGRGHGGPRGPRR